MVVWETYLQRIADFTGLTLTEAGTIHSLIITVLLIVIILIASKGRYAQLTVPVTSFFSILLFTYMQWFPVWTGSVIALTLVIFIGWSVSRIPGGR